MLPEYRGDEGKTKLDAADASLGAHADLNTIEYSQTKGVERGEG